MELAKSYEVSAPVKLITGDTEKVVGNVFYADTISDNKNLYTVINPSVDPYGEVVTHINRISNLTTSAQSFVRSGISYGTAASGIHWTYNGTEPTLFTNHHGDATGATNVGWLTVSSNDYTTYMIDDVIDGFTVSYTVTSKPTKREMVRDYLKRLLTTPEQVSRNKFGIEITPEELRARQTLREMLTESDFRRFLTNGFIMVKGDSGRYYQVFLARHERIRVYVKGKHVHNLCIHTNENCPPTDHVISMKTLIECDEDAIYALANKHQVYNPSLSVSSKTEQNSNLVQLWNTLKVG